MLRLIEYSITPRREMGKRQIQDFRGELGTPHSIAISKTHTLLAFFGHFSDLVHSNHRGGLCDGMPG